MHIVTGIVQLAFLAHAHAWNPGANHMGDAQDAMDSMVDKVIEKMADKLSDRMLNLSPLVHKDLDDMTLGKPGQVSMPASHISSPSAITSRYFSNSHSALPFSAKGQVRPGPNREVAAAAAMGGQSRLDRSAVVAKVASMNPPAVVEAPKGPSKKRSNDWGEQLPEALIEDWATAFVNVEKELDGAKINLVRGSIPPELRGTLFRNVPGQLEREDQSVHHVFDGDGMIVAFRFTDEGVEMSNKFVRTEGWEKEEEAGRFLHRGIFGTQKPGGPLANAFDLRLKNVANTHVVQLGDQLLALWEAGSPHALDPVSLKTHGPTTLNGVLQPNEEFSAHPRFDPGHHGTPRMVTFGVKAGPSSTIRLMEFATHGPEAGRIISDRRDSFPGFAFLHDFVITPNWAIFLQNPMEMNILPFVLGMKGAGQTLQRKKGAQPKFILIPRDCGAFAGQPPRLINAPDGFVFHHVNAWEEDEDIVVESLYYERFPTIDEKTNFRELDFDEYPGATLTQVRLNLAEGGFRKKTVNGRYGEFAMVNPRNEGLSARYAWMAGASRQIGKLNAPLQNIMKVDMVTGDRRMWFAGKRGFVTEPEMVPRPGATAEDDGWVLNLVQNGARRGTDLVILNANDMSEQAVLELPFILPYGLHGSWVQNTIGDTI